MENLENKAVEFIYQETEIHFLLGNEKNVMVNATEMAILFGKKPNDFLRLDSTKSYIESYLKKQNSKLYYGISRNINEKYTENDVYFSQQKSGTYMIRPLALKFAAWLDSDFEVWVFDIIDEIIFGKAKAVGNKISEAELKKEKIKQLIKDARESGNETAIAILDSFDELKAIEKEKKKSMAMFSNQFKMDFN